MYPDEDNHKLNAKLPLSTDQFPFFSSFSLIGCIRKLTLTFGRNFEIHVSGES